MILLKGIGAIFAIFLLSSTLHLADLRRHESTALQLAFVSDVNGVSQLHRTDFNGNNLRPLSDGRGDDYAPAWSPNGEYVAFVSFRGRASYIYLIPSAGGVLIEIPLAIGSAINPRWSPSSEYLVFERYTSRGDRSIVGYDVAARDLNLLTSNDQRDWGPAWSGRDDAVLYVSSNDSLAYDQLHIVSLADESSRQLTNSDKGHHSPTWSQDGRYVVYESDLADLWLLDLDTGHETQLTATPTTYESMPVFSPDGASIVFIAESEPGRQQLYRMTLADGRITQLSDAQEVVSVIGSAKWSAGGNWLAYVGISTESGRTAIYRVHRNGTGHQRLTPTDYNSSAPTWSPPVDGELTTACPLLLGGLAVATVVASRRRPR